MSLSTSIAAYDSASPDSWVGVTAAEYDKLLTQVTQAVTYGATESFMNLTPASSWNTNVTIGSFSQVISTIRKPY